MGMMCDGGDNVVEGRRCTTMMEKDDGVVE